MLEDEGGVEFDFREQTVPVPARLPADLREIPQETAAVLADAEDVADKAHGLVDSVYPVYSVCLVKSPSVPIYKRGCNPPSFEKGGLGTICDELCLAESIHSMNGTKKAEPKELCLNFVS